MTAHQDPAMPAVGPLRYGITYTAGPDEYDDMASRALFEECAALPGATYWGEDWSLPPVRGLTFIGTPEQQDQLEKCLRELPNTILFGPLALPVGE